MEQDVEQASAPATMLQLLPRFLDALLCTSPAVIYASGAGWWQGPLHYIGANVETLCGLERETLRASPQRWLTLLTYDSRQAALAQLERACRGDASCLSLSYALRHEDGSLRYLQDDIVIHRDGDGQVTELVGSLADVTERQSRLEQLDILCRQLPGVLYQCRLAVDGQLTFPLVSSGVQRLFGLSPTDNLNRPEAALARIHPEDAAALWRSIRRSAARLSVWRHEFRYRHPEGHQLWVSGHATPERGRDGSVLWHGFCEDVTLRKQAQLALFESECRYRFIVEHVSDLIMLMDTDGVCRFASSSACNVLGYLPEDLHARALIELLPPDDAPRIQRHIHESARLGRELKMELRVRHSQGHYIWLETHCSPYVSPDSGRYEWILAVSRDITERKLREMRLQELSTTDSLTGALNRGAFLGCLKSAIDAADEVSSRLSLIIFDIDHFKVINDTWGHAAGDVVLASLGEICRSTLRSQDVFGRIGGEEFALVMAEQSLRESARLAERLRQKFENVRVEFHGQWLSFTVSFGIAERGMHESMDELMHRADMGLYAAKRQGRNRVHQAICVNS